MKQTKWQRLATIGLCSSLVINAFSGVTAVAETITIESSPTVASSAKEATSASSATPESTESSQETTETSREEVAQETEKPEVVEEETEAKKQEEETVTSEVVQPNPVLTPTPVSGIGVRAGNLAETYQYFLEIQKKFQINGSQAQVVTPNIAIGVNLTSSEGATVNIDDFELRSTVRTSTSLWDPSYGGYRTSYSTPENISSTKLTNSIQMNIPSKILRAQANATYTVATYSFYLEDVSLSVPKYISNVFVGEPLAIKGIRVGAFAIPTTATLDIKKINQETYKLETNPNTGNAGNVFSTAVSHSLNRSEFGTVLAEKDLELSVVFKKVTESFKDTAGATIPAPTGFTQGKQTSITSNNYTFKQAGTLPETYKASNGKTYKFKGWYKGKTKPNTLTTTKAPSYPVTYDDNDDLNVVYEEIEAFDFPALTYQFGFVNEAGQLINPANIPITYDYAKGSWTPVTANLRWTMVPGSASTVGNLKNVTMPAASIATPPGPTWVGNTEVYANFSIKIPRYYSSMSLYDRTGKINPTYPLPSIAHIGTKPHTFPQASVITWLGLTSKGNNMYGLKETNYTGDPAALKFPIFMMRLNEFNNAGSFINYTTVNRPIYYHLTNRRVTENFVDANGTKITPPTGFTQGKQTVIDSDPYTFKQSGTLPDTYTTGGKTYKFKGWYKGKTKPNTLTTTKAPSYAVTYDDNDDLNVVYEEETVTMLYPTMNVNFVDEKGVGFTPALTFSGKYYAQSTSASLRTDLYDVTSKNNGNGQYTISVNNGSMPLSQELLKKYNNGQPIGITSRLQFNVDKLTIDQQLKYVDSIQVDTAQSRNLKSYRHEHMTDNSLIFDPNVPQSEADLRSEYVDLFRFNSDGTYFSNASNRFFNMHLGYSTTGVNYLLVMILFNANPVNPTKLVYTVTRKQVTENFVDTNGTKITPPTGFTQGNQIPMTSNTFKYTSARALPASYTTGGKTYIFQGWYKGKETTTPLKTTTTPSFTPTFDENDDMTAVYQEAVPTAELTVKGSADIVENGATMDHWEVLLKNTGEAPLTTIKIKPTATWAAGISPPNTIFVLGTGQNAKAYPVTKEQWAAGFSLPLNTPLPAGGQLQMNLLGTAVTGNPGQVLTAEVEVTGNFGSLIAKDTVRIKDLDQEITNPDGDGFISTPTFDFGKLAISGSKQQYGLKKAADYYGNGTRNPYLRLNTSQDNWSLTAQLSQPKSATDSLPTTTRLLLGTAAAASFTDYNQPTETKTPLGKTGTVNLTTDNTATAVVANQQFTGSDVYQLDFTFANIKLEVPANQGMSGQQYQAAVTWNLVTGP
ncbi:WxL domain-containing protein [Enterococcus faecalis]|uniref:WxL domain-containing protein n=3 Tax=Enterococcus faecalis TaxID=1351 RepID=UPI00226E624A